jgi:hypothetical protein
MKEQSMGGDTGKKVSFNEDVEVFDSKTPDSSLKLEHSFRLSDFISKEDRIRNSFNCMLTIVFFSKETQKKHLKYFTEILNRTNGFTSVIFNIKDKNTKYFDLEFRQAKIKNPSDCNEGSSINDLSEHPIRIGIYGRQFSDEKLKEALAVTILVTSGINELLSCGDQDLHDKNYEKITSSLKDLGINEDRVDDVMDKVSEINKNIANKFSRNRNIKAPEMLDLLKKELSDYIFSSRDITSSRGRGI